MVRAHPVSGIVISPFEVFPVLLFPVVLVMPVLYPFRMIIGPVRLVVYDPGKTTRSNIMAVPWFVNVVGVVGIDIATVVRKMPVAVIMHMQVTDPGNPPEVVVIDLDLACLYDPAVMIVVDRDIFYLYNRPVIVILNIGIVVVAGVITDTNIRGPYIQAVSCSAGVKKEIELSIGVDCEFYAPLDEYKGIGITVSQVGICFGLSYATNH